MIWTSDIAAKITGGKIFSSWISGKLVFDSRLIEPGDTFIALPGSNADGHDYVVKALEKGAAAAIVSKIPPNLKNNNKILLVENTLNALSTMAMYKRSVSKAKFIAVTGSVGKTSTKELLGLALAEHGNTFISRGNYNNFLGVPINLASLSDNTEFAVFEIGMDHAGEITPLTDLVHPHLAIITSIENIHRANFDSIEGIASAKAEIFHGLFENSSIIINSLSNCYKTLIQEANSNKNITRIITLGVDSKVTNYAIENNNTFAKLNVLGQEVALTIDNILGAHQVHNMMTALTCIAELGLDPLKSAKALQKFKLPRGRGEVSRINVKNKNITLIDDSYNAGPVSVKAALKNMSYYSGRKVAILGDMTEMGPDSLILHIALKEDIAQNNIDKVICFGSQMENLYYALPESKRLGHYTDLKHLAKDLPEKLVNGDILLIKGSLYLTNLYGFTKHLAEGTLHAI